MDQNDCVKIATRDNVIPYRRKWIWYKIQQNTSTWQHYEHVTEKRGVKIHTQ